jgi:VCBS repeat-containing protein
MSTSAPAISGTTGSVYEDSVWPIGSNNLTSFGGITITGDQGQSSFVAQSGTAGTYGTFTLVANGIWTYTADNTRTVIQQLGSGQSLTDSFTAMSADGTLSVPITVTINGTNDAAVIGGVSTGSVIEDVNVSNGNLTTGGTQTNSDLDQGQSSFRAQTSTSGFYGTFSLATDGAWTYTVDNSQTPMLAAGAIATDSFTALSSDGTAGQRVTVAINGAPPNAIVPQVYDLTFASGDHIDLTVSNSLRRGQGIGPQPEGYAVLSASGTINSDQVTLIGSNGVAVD